MEPIEDVPKLIPNSTESKILLQQRSDMVKMQALTAAGFKCECKCSHELFLRKDYKIPYTEAHHLVPLHYQSDFLYSLDVPANVVSLCPSCHRRLHYGNEVEAMLEQLWKDRKSRLEKCGISISFQSLLLMYR